MAFDGMEETRGLHIGPVDLHPHFEFISAYNDNVFLQEKEQGDFAFVVSPGMQFILGQSQQNFIGLDYTASFERFVRFDSQDANNQFLKLDSRFEVNKLTLAASHLFQDIEGPNIQIGGRVHSRDNITHLSAEYRMSSKTSLGLGYDQYLHDYRLSGLIDSKEYAPYVALYYHMTPKFDLFCRLGLGWVRVDDGNNATYEQAEIGVRGKLTSKITGTAQVGYQHRSFSQNYEDINTVVASADLQAQLTRRTALDVGVSRSVNPSPSVYQNSYEATRVEARLIHTFPRKKINLWIGGAYEFDEYENPIDGADREDDFCEASVGVAYDISKNIHLSLEYLFWNNDSTFDELSFTRNLVSFHARVHF